MRIGGFLPCSLVDYPGKVCAVVFTQGCNFRCPFCHNAGLVAARGETEIPEESVLERLQKRKRVLDGVVVTGGEPTLQEDLDLFLRKLKTVGFSVKLDTNGSRPEILRKLLQEKLVDFVAMDIKAPWKNYEAAAGKPLDVSPLKESVALLKQAEIPVQFRTTTVRPLHRLRDFLEISKIADGKPYVLQTFQNGKILSGSFAGEAKPFAKKQLQKWVENLKDKGIPIAWNG